MSKRISLAKLSKKVEEKKENKAATSSTIGVVIQEKLPQEEVPSTSPIKKGEVDNSKGKEKEMPPRWC